MRRREHGLQIAVAHMLTITLDPAHTWWSSIDHGVGKLGKAEAGIRKRRGVKRGLPDIIIMARHEQSYLGPLMFGIELKSDDGALTDAQVEIANTWQHLGFDVYVARSVEEVQDILLQRAIPMVRKLTFFSGGDHARPGRLAGARHPRSRRRRRRAEDAVPVVQRRPAQEN